MVIGTHGRSVFVLDVSAIRRSPTLEDLNMKKQRKLLSASRTAFLAFLWVLVAPDLGSRLQASAHPQERPDPPVAENNQIRRDKFDVVLPEVMRERGIDMWIHVVREAIPDAFAAGELGITSGVVIFTDRGADRIERAILGRRWGAGQRDLVATEYLDPVGSLDAYDIIGRPVFVRQPVAGPMTEHDYRFQGLSAFVAARDPQRVGVNFKRDLVKWPTSRGIEDGLSHSDYLLLAEELGPRYAERLVSSEWVMMDYIHRKVPSEIELLRRMQAEEVAGAERAFAAVEPGVTPARGSGTTVLRRMGKGLSQRGRSTGWEDTVIQGGDIVAAPSVGMYAYVLRAGETEPPAEIQRLWAEYLKVDRILADTISAGLTGREIVENYTPRFAEEGIVVRAEQLHMAIPKNDFGAYSAAFDAGLTHLAIDVHGFMKGARPRPVETYFGPRIGSNGPEWALDIPLQPNHHFVIEYFLYLPSPGNDGENQYLLWWDHEQAIATDRGIEYLTPPQTELILIR